MFTKINLLLLFVVSAFVLINCGMHSNSNSEICVGEVEQVSTGYNFLEGPAYSSQEQALYFTDMSNRRTIRYDERSGESTVFRTRGGNGLCVDAKGALIICGTTDQSALVYRDREGNEKILNKLFENKSINKPNDITLDQRGGIYFSSPAFGKKVHPSRVYYRTPEGVLKKVIEEEAILNGVHLSPNDRCLYVVTTKDESIWSWEVQKDGTLKNGKPLIHFDTENHGRVDGMTVDEKGNVYGGCRVGVVVWNPKGEVIEVIRTPEPAANCIFGGLDGKTLYITAQSLYRVRTKYAGRKNSVAAIDTADAEEWDPDSEGVNKALLKFQIPSEKWESTPHTRMIGDKEFSGIKMSHSTKDISFSIAQYETTTQDFFEMLCWALDPNSDGNQNDALITVKVKSDQNFTVMLVPKNPLQANESWISKSLYVSTSIRPSGIVWKNNTFELSSCHKLPNGSTHRGSHPVTHVSWYGALFYCYYLNYLDGKAEQCISFVKTSKDSKWVVDREAKGYRLPSQQEWLNCYRPFDDTMVNYSQQHRGFDVAGFPFTTAAATFSANDLGIHNMLGSVWEWTLDYGSTQISTNAKNITRMTLGGCWASSKDMIQKNPISAMKEMSGSMTTGFRVLFNN